MPVAALNCEPQSIQKMLAATTASAAAIHIDPRDRSCQAIPTLRILIAASAPIVHQGDAGSPVYPQIAMATATIPKQRAAGADQSSGVGCVTAAGPAIILFIASVASGSAHAATKQPASNV
jgi:hypothetical protein